MFSVLIRKKNIVFLFFKQIISTLFYFIFLITKFHNGMDVITCKTIKYFYAH